MSRVAEPARETPVHDASLHGASTLIVPYAQLREALVAQRLFLG